VTRIEERGSECLINSKEIIGNFGPRRCLSAVADIPENGDMENSHSHPRLIRATQKTPNS
jgi:hypothetical protein